MEVFEIKNLSFSYQESEKNVLDDISFTVKNGEFVCVCGKSGCGKTTLLRLLKPSVSPSGEMSGEILYCKKNLNEIAPKEQASQIGFVFQSCDSQIVTDKVWHELAFGLESLGLKNDEIRARVAETASFFGIENLFHQNTAELSGGQRQIVALASVMVMRPEVLILDEPTSQLDPIAAEEFIKTLQKINRELGTTIILSEHRLDDVFSACDRVIVIENSKLIADAAPSDVVGRLIEQKSEMYCAMPSPARVCAALGETNKYPVNVHDGRIWLEAYAEKNQPVTMPESTATEPDCTDEAIYVKDVWFRYEKNGNDIIKDLEMKVYKGETFAVMGGNGSGKTTLLSLLSGINRPYRGKILINKKPLHQIDDLYTSVLGVLPQNPQTLFTHKTVRLNLEAVVNEKDKDRAEEIIRKYAKICRITPLLDRHPYDLSGGEQQRAALCMILIRNPAVILLDEPTKSLDAHFRLELAEIIRSLKSDKKTIIIVSHDTDFCAMVCDRCAMFFDGKIISENNTKRFFSSNSYYTTSVCRMAKTVDKSAVTVEDILLIFGKKEPEQKNDDYDEPDESGILEKKEISGGEKCITPPKSNTKLSWQSFVSMAVMLIAVPATILFGLYALDGKKYYFISLMIILEILIPMGLFFEGRHHKTGKLVMISVLS
ncbi:MAG: energy-coupling factor ABC transporter ATP-binding protein, partial [Clostridia bacterium]|nr:energy-coupling factor ABC transporter ATP-binding protein [Clostridia bacterium]